MSTRSETRKFVHLSARKSFEELRPKSSAHFFVRKDAFVMNADDTRGGRVPGIVRHHIVDRIGNPAISFIGIGHKRRRPSGYAVSYQERSYLAKCVGTTNVHIVAGCSVVMNIDKTGHDQRSVQVDHFARKIVR